MLQTALRLCQEDSKIECVVLGEVSTAILGNNNFSGDATHKKYSSKQFKNAVRKGIAKGLENIPDALKGKVILNLFRDIDKLNSVTQYS